MEEHQGVCGAGAGAGILMCQARHGITHMARHQRHGLQGRAGRLTETKHRETTRRVNEVG